MEPVLADSDNLGAEKLLELKIVDEEMLHALLVGVLLVAEWQNPLPAKHTHI